MFDTYVTVVGTVLTTPEWRRTTTTNTLVANFKVASHSRKFDRDSGRWVDGDSLRVRVNCWRRLAEGVASSVMVGDPVLVTGRMYTRDWLADDGARRVSYELEAVAVGHDLARGRGSFTRNRPNTATSAVEDAESDGRVAGAQTEAVAGQARAGEPDAQPWAGEPAARPWGSGGLRTAVDDPEDEEHADDGDFDPVEFDAATLEVNAAEADAAALLGAAGLKLTQPGSDEEADPDDPESSDGTDSGAASALPAARGGRRGRNRATAGV